MPWFDGIAPSAPGSLVATTEGARAFLPAPLPTGLPLPAASQRLLADARGELGKLWGIGRLLRNPRLFVRPLQAREAAASSRIEGTKTTNEEALANEAVGIDPGADPDAKEVQNYLQALGHGVTSLHRGRALNRGLLLELHRKLLEGGRGQTAVPGRFRESQAFLGKDTDTIHTARFVPPPAIHVDVCMEQLQHYLDDRSHDDPLVRVAMVHYQFETIHPFEDGNGRVGRLLIALQTIADGLQHQPLLYVSSRLEARRQDYYDRLLQVSLDGDFLPWVDFFLGEVLASARDTAEKVHALLGLLDGFREQLRSVGTVGPLRLVDLLEQWPFFTVEDARRHLGVEAPATARAAIDSLVQAGIVAEYGRAVRRTRGRPAKVYWCEPIVRVLRT